MPRVFPLLLACLGLSASPALPQEPAPAPNPAEPAPAPGPAEPAPAPAEPAAAPASWLIKLDRRPAIGDRTSVSASGHQNRKVETTSPSQPREITEEQLEVTYAAIHEVRAVDSEGRPRELLIRIDRLVTDDGSGPQDQFPAGTQITATADGDLTRYRLGRDELDGTLCDALNLAGAKLPSANEPSEDAVFLNHSARRPGERWTADPQRLADAIAATSPFTVDPVTSTGEIRFDEPVTENGIPALATTTTYQIVPTAFRTSPSGQPLTQSSVTSKTVRLFPVDPALPVLRETLDTSMKLTQRPPAAPSNTGTETLFHRQITRRFLPLPKP